MASAVLERQFSWGLHEASFRSIGDEDIDRQSPSSPKSPKENWAKLRASVRVAAAFKRMLALKREHTRAAIWLAVAIIGTGCCSAVPFELLNKADRGCSNLILLVQYLYATGECLLSGKVNEFVLDRKVPLAFHLAGLALFGATNACFNAALNLGLPMPAYLVIKNGGLVMSMGLGWAVQRKSFCWQQVVAVVCITMGVIATCFASKPAPKVDSVASGPSAGTFLLAAGVMSCGVTATCFLNIVQETAFSRHGKHFQECMFYMHILGVPLFAFVGADMWSHARTWMSHWSTLPLPAPLNIPLPTMWLLLLLNVSMAQIMKMSCLKLTDLAGAMPNVLVVTLFRFVSVIVSAVALNSPPFPPPSMWFGSLLVLGGTVLYLLFSLKPKPSAHTQKKD